MLKCIHETREPPGHNCFFFLSTILLFLNMIIFFLISHIDFAKFRAEGRNMYFPVDRVCPVSPRLTGAATLLVVRWQQVEMVMVDWKP